MVRKSSETFVRKHIKFGSPEGFNFLSFCKFDRADLSSEKAIFLNLTKSKRPDLLQLTFPEIESILLNCLPLPRMSVLHVPQVISSSDNARDLIKISPKKDK